MTQSTGRFLFLGLFLVTSISVCSARESFQESPLFQIKTDLVSLLRRADQQRDWMKELASKKEVDLSQLSLEQIKDTITKLREFRERLINLKDAGQGWGSHEERFLLLVQKLLSELTQARMSYEKHMESSHSVKKIAIPLGAAVAVTGGLILLGTFAPDLVDIDLSSAILCGLATGAAVGAITYKGDVIRGLSALKESVTSAWRTRSLRAIGKVSASVVGAAAVGGLLWSKRESIAGTFGFRGKQKKSLEQMAYENLPADVH